MLTLDEHKMLQQETLTLNEAAVNAESMIQSRTTINQWIHNESLWLPDHEPVDLDVVEADASRRCGAATMKRGDRRRGRRGRGATPGMGAREMAGGGSSLLPGHAVAALLQGIAAAPLNWQRAQVGRCTGRRRCGSAPVRRSHWRARPALLQCHTAEGGQRTVALPCHTIWG
jgi:hypothetical protein